MDPDLAAAWDMPAAARGGGAQDESGLPPLAELGAMGSLSALEQQLADAHEGRLGAGVPLGDSASFRMSGLPLASSLSSNFNLESVLKATSMTDLGLNFRRSASQLRDKNVSELSLGSILDQGAAPPRLPSPAADPASALARLNPRRPKPCTPEPFPQAGRTSSMRSCPSLTRGKMRRGEEGAEARHP